VLPRNEIRISFFGRVSVPGGVQVAVLDRRPGLVVVRQTDASAGAGSVGILGRRVPVSFLLLLAPRLSNGRGHPNPEPRDASGAYLKRLAAAEAFLVGFVCGTVLVGRLRRSRPMAIIMFVV
jgi:hypothetical protein